MRRFFLILSVGFFLGLSVNSFAQEKGKVAGEQAVVRQAVVRQGGIAWYGTLTSALAEAKRTGKPILLVSAAPHCHSISGIW